MRAAGPRNYLGKDLGLLCGRQPSDLCLSVSSTQSGLRAAARFDAGQHQASYRAQGTHATSGRKKKCLVAPSDPVPMAWLSNSSDSSMITGKGKRRQIRRVRESQGGGNGEVHCRVNRPAEQCPRRPSPLSRPLAAFSSIAIKSASRGTRTDADQRTEGDRRWMKEMSFEVRPFCG